VQRFVSRQSSSWGFFFSSQSYLPFPLTQNHVYFSKKIHQEQDEQQKEQCNYMCRISKTQKNNRRAHTLKEQKENEQEKNPQRLTLPHAAAPTKIPPDPRPRGPGRSPPSPSCAQPLHCRLPDKRRQFGD
jgi:hypothetical protein